MICVKWRWPCSIPSYMTSCVYIYICVYVYKQIVCMYADLHNFIHICKSLQKIISVPNSDKRKNIESSIHWMLIVTETPVYWFFLFESLFPQRLRLDFLSTVHFHAERLNCSSKIQARFTVWGTDSTYPFIPREEVSFSFFPLRLI